MNKLQIWWHKFYVKHSVWDISIKCFYNDISHNDELAKYLYNKLKDIIRIEYEIPVYELSYELLNTNRQLEHYAVGRYTYLRDTPISLQRENSRSNVDKFHKFLTLQGRDDELRGLVHPRIEIAVDKNSWSSKLMTLAHEFGHHLIQIEEAEQSEELADAKVSEIFQKYFNPIFMGIYNISLNIHNPKFKIENYKKHYIDHYMSYVLGENELKLKLI